MIGTVSFFNRRQAHLCVLANNCDEAMYVKLVEALCTEHNISLLKVSNAVRKVLYYISLFEAKFCVN